MKRTGLLVLWILALLTGLLCGCGKTPAAEPTDPAALPSLYPETGESWGPEQTQSFPEGPGYSIPDVNPDPDESFGETPTAVPGPEPTYSPDPEASGIPGLDSPEDYPGPSETIPEPYIPENPLPSRNPTETVGPERPGPAPDAAALQAALERALEGQQGTWSVYVKNLDTGETVSIHDEPMIAASLIKLYVAGAYYTTDPAARKEARCKQVDVMINISSNDACNSLIDYLGKDTVNTFIRLSGFKDSLLNRRMLEQSDLENYTSARECGQVLESILTGEYVSEAASARLLENLKQQQRTEKIPAGVPEGVETANKTGELSNVENDACIVWSEGGTYILCIMSEELTDVTAARREIVALSKLVYEYFNH